MNLALAGEVRVIRWGGVFGRGSLGWYSVNELHRPTAAGAVIRAFHIRHTPSVIRSQPCTVCKHEAYSGLSR